jgi:hypothetical protein
MNETFPTKNAVVYCDLCQPARIFEMEFSNISVI